MAFRQQNGVFGIIPTLHFQTNHLLQFLRAERQERLTQNGEMRHNLQRQGHHSLHTLGVGLDLLPRLVVGEVFVAQTGEVHQLGEGLAELVGVQQMTNLLRIGVHFLDDGIVGVGEVA